MRRIWVSTLLVGVCLLLVGIGSGASAHSHAKAALDGTLANKASEEAEVLADYFSRARSIDLLTAHNPAFQQLYRLPGDRAATVRSGGPVLDQINQALAYLEELFPTSIGEACFIDRTGPENARVVRGKRAAPPDLSADESGNPFFRPTFALTQGEVYQAPPYVSPDTGEWVISNSTLMPTPDRSKRAIVHFEITIDSFRQVAATLSNQLEIAVVDAHTSAVILDSHHPQRIGAPLGVPGDHRFHSIVKTASLNGLRTFDRRPAAYQRLKPTPGNANHWYVVTVSPRPVGLLYGVGLWSVALVVAALVLLGIAAVSFLAHHRVLVAASLTDHLTGIGNRRKLKLDLDRALAQATPDRPLLLMMFDLNGFKAYNDTFGHPAGDALLVRLASALDTAMAERGASAYRLGGDEFCILAPIAQDTTTSIAAAASQALSEHGAGFAISASYGEILLPQEAHDVAEAMRTVDQRMYAHKTSARRSPDRQSRDVLLRVLRERSPELAERHAAVARLAGAVADHLGLPPAEHALLRHAAELHDVGNTAIPEQILHKPGPLDADEWAFMQQHPLIGERIIAAAPALAEAARLVRSSHERVDGTGYPEGLEGEQIPLGARIIMVCDAFVAMTAPRPYAAQRSTTEATAELKRCAGTQFDPKLVDIVCDLIAEPDWQRLAASAPAGDPVQSRPG